MLNCWKEIPSKRPTFDELVEVLEEMLLKIGDVVSLDVIVNVLQNGFEMLPCIR